ncbi:hypothetical protein L1887_40430 [Cichorium endivia]|nr:hypothetical protein L1887_40430 [Cichorium endivia]
MAVTVATIFRTSASSFLVSRLDKKRLWNADQRWLASSSRRLPATLECRSPLRRSPAVEILRKAPAPVSGPDSDHPLSIPPEKRPVVVIDRYRRLAVVLEKWLLEWAGIVAFSPISCNDLRKLLKGTKKRENRRRWRVLCFVLLSA